MVIVVAAAATAAGYGVYKGGQSAVQGVKNKIEKVKDGRQKKKEDQGLSFIRQKKQEEAARKEAINTAEKGEPSISDRVARFKTGIGSQTEKKPPGRFSRFGKKGDN
jgi:hypothetical protein